jgi:hypothetical protein
MPGEKVANGREVSEGIKKQEKREKKKRNLLAN